jgi:hypothetical protein
LGAAKGRLARPVTVGAFGHSLGASAVAGAMLVDRLLRASVMLDGVVLPRARRGTIRQPLVIGLGAVGRRRPGYVSTGGSHWR